LKRFAFCVSLVLLLTNTGFAQQYSSLRSKYFSTAKDTVMLDTLSVVPGSVKLYTKTGLRVDDFFYNVDYINGFLIRNKNQAERVILEEDTLHAVYRVFYLRLNQVFKHKDTTIISAETPFLYNPFSSGASGEKYDPFRFEGLNKSGSISRGISFGNNQDVVVNSSLNLQLSGKVSDNINILAAITDENIPFQPEGNTQQLQDFDKVYIQLFNEHNKLTAGDYDLKKPDSYFMNFYKRVQGASFATVFNTSNRQAARNDTMRTMASFSVAKGKVARNIIAGIEGNQGPYRLTGNNNELFIIVLSGTERIFLDGVQLTRGQQYDYIIDYNTAQVTFTPRHLITKDSRIVAEFEYSDKYFLRTLLYFNNEYERNKVKLKFNFYNEQDSKNQPLQQELDSARKQTLSNAGDNLLQAFYSTADSVAFNADQVMYAKVDTVDCLGNPYSYYIYSTSDTAHWQLTFSAVPQGAGNYVPDITAANGKVYRFVPPVGCQSQGNYQPIALLVSPKKQQMMTLGADVKFSETSTLTTEAAYTKNDINLLSSKDKANDDGYALRATYNKILRLDTAQNGWRLSSSLGYEHISKYFTPIERFRAVEFERDWNLVNVQPQTEQMGTLELQLNRASVGNITYQSKYFQRGEPYSAFNNILSSNVTLKKFRLLNTASYLTTAQDSAQTQYLRHHTDLSKTFGKFTLGTIEEGERNRFFVSSDSLNLGSFQYQQLQFYVALSDTGKYNLRADVSRRNDFQVRRGELKPSTVADNASTTIEFTKNQNHLLSLGATYRQLRITDSTLAFLQPQESFLGSVQYRMTLLKGGLTSNTYFEIGTGQEQKKQYIYLEVPTGQGIYKYGGDYNANGIKELDEFVLAAFQSDANYVRIFLPTNEYVTVRSNQLNEVLSITPSSFIKSVEDKTNFFSRLSNQTQGRVERKTMNESFVESLNPFRTSIEDTSLVTLTSLLRNTFYFNRNNSVYGFDLTWQQNSTKTLLSNGLDYRVLVSKTGNARWNISRSFLLTVMVEETQKTSNSEFFASQDYDLKSLAYEPRLAFQPGNVFRVSIGIRPSTVENQLGILHEKAEKIKSGIDIKYTSLSAGILSATVDYTSIKYNAQDNTSLAYEMLEGLHPGQNITWGLSLQRNISAFMQLTLNYEGRKSEKVQTIHTGGMQLRAYF
jgi:hypothetical protein